MGINETIHSKGDELVKDLIEVWYKPRMRIAMILSALFYAVLTIPFKNQLLIFGEVEIRPSAFIPVLSSFVFGPAGAWGSAFGNLLSDAFGSFNRNSIFGFFGNLFLGYLPYKIWFHLFRGKVHHAKLNLERGGDFRYVLLSGVIANLFCALIIAWGLYMTSNMSFMDSWHIIFVNNVIALVFLWPSLKLFIPLCERYEINWFSENQYALKSKSTPREQFFMLLTVAMIISGTLVSLGLSFVELRMNYESAWYIFIQYSIIVITFIHIMGAVIYSIKD